MRSDVENVVGGAGGDTLVGSAAANLLAGGEGNDHLVGAGGADTLDGGGGDDLIDAVDGGADAVVCGPGDDTVNADAQDAVGADCEHVTRPAAAAPAGDAGATGAAGPAPAGALAPQSVLVAGGSLALRAHRRVKATLACPRQPAPCAGRLTLRPRQGSGAAFGSVPFRLSAGTIRAVNLTLSRTAATRVRRAHRMPATLIATGGPARVAVPVTITR